MPPYRYRVPICDRATTTMESRIDSAVALNAANGRRSCAARSVPSSAALCRSHHRRERDHRRDRAMAKASGNQRWMRRRARHDLELGHTHVRGRCQLVPDREVLASGSLEPALTEVSGLCPLTSWPTDVSAVTRKRCYLMKRDG